MKSRHQIRVKKTPNCAHQYTAVMKGRGEYGWGDTPAAAKDKLMEQINSMPHTNSQIEAVARAVATEMGLDWERLEDRYSIKWSKQNVRKYWRDVATVALDAANMKNVAA